MSNARSLPSLRAVLLVDAVTCAAMGALLVPGSALVGGLTRIPPTLLFCAGLILLPIAAFMGLVATRSVIPPAGVWLVVAGNIAWLAGSLALPAVGWIAPNGLGLVFIVAQAAVVGLLAALEYLGWNESVRVAQEA